MNTKPILPYSPNWNAQDIANAVPLRLFELFGFNAGANGTEVVDRCANQLPRRTLRNGYLRQRDLPAFVRVHS